MIRGYVTSRSFAGLTLPVPAQNAVLREYARSVSQTYVLPLLEHKFDNCFMQLFTVLDTAEPYDTIAMYSISMLPIHSNSKLSSLRTIALGKQLSFYFALEAVHTHDLFNQQLILKSYSFRSLLDTQNTSPTISLIRSLLV